MNKACPVILRSINGSVEVLAFTHPLAGNQLVKGTIQLHEHLKQACIRELKEESGIAAQPTLELGSWNAHYQNQIWGFCLMETCEPLPDSWEFFTQDDGGHLFRFFWQPLCGELNSEWHPLFVGALKYLGQALRKI